MDRLQEIKARDKAACLDYSNVYDQLHESGYLEPYCRKMAEQASARVYESWPIEGDH